MAKNSESGENNTDGKPLTPVSFLIRDSAKYCQYPQDTNINTNNQTEKDPKAIRIDYINGNYPLNKEESEIQNIFKSEVALSEEPKANGLLPHWPSYLLLCF